MVKAPGDAPALIGTIPIFLTPFDEDGSLDFGQVDAEIAFLLERGVTWIGLGFGSEVQRLAPDELAKLSRHIVSVGGGEITLVGNAEIFSVDVGIANVLRARDVGASAVMVRPTALDGVGSDEICDSIAEIASACGVPIVVQDAPRNTGVDLPVGGLVKLLEMPETLALKLESPDSSAKFSSVRERAGEGDGSLIGGKGGVEYVFELGRGAHGTMPGPAYPEVFDAIRVMHDEGDHAGAISAQARIQPLVTLGSRSMDRFLVVQKHVLTKRGVLSGTTLRRPCRAGDAELLQEVDAVMDALELMEFFDECAAMAR